MPQTVDIPDQGTAEFPDEMSPDDIKSVIQQKFFSQPTPPPVLDPLGVKEAGARAMENAPADIPEPGAGGLPNVTGVKMGRISAAPPQIVNPEVAKFAATPLLTIPSIPQQESLPAQIGAGIVNASSGAAESLTAPANLAALPLLPFKRLGPIISGLYSGQMLSGVPGAISEAERQPTVQGRLQGGLGALLQLFGGIATGAHAAGGLAGRLSPVLTGEAPKAETPIVTPPETVNAAPVEPGVAPEPVLPPILRAGEKGTADLFQGGDQPFNLAGETAIDYEGRAREAEAAEDVRQEAAIATEKNQGKLGSGPGESVIEPKSKSRGPADQFGGDITPTAAMVINDLGGVISKSQAIKTGRYEGNKDLWDDIPSLQHPTHNKIYSTKGVMPDEAAQGLYDAGLIREPTPAAMWDAIGKESKTARSIAEQERQGRIVGAAVKMPDGEVFSGTHHSDAIDEAARSGRYSTEDIIKAENEGTANQGFVDARGRFYDREGALQQAKKSKQVQPEEYAAKAKELGLQPNALENEVLKAVQRPSEDVDPWQLNPPLSPARASEPEAIRGGVRPAEQVVAGSANPVQAYEMSPQALGVTHPLPGFLKSISDYFTRNTPSQIANTLKGSIGATLGKTFAKTTIADREAGELGARWISSRIAAPHLAETFSTNVLDGVNPVKFGAALTEDNLRSVRATAEKEGRSEDARNVTSIVGAKGSPFKTEAEYKSFLQDPATQAALERHRALWAETIDPMYRQAQKLEPGEPLPSRGEETQARINLYNDTKGAGKDVVAGTGTGNLTATLGRKSPFAIQAKGTGRNYNVNYNDMMANTFGRQLEIANKNAFEQKLVDSGNAVIGRPGENPVLPDGEETTAFPLKRTALIKAESGEKIPVNQNIYVRKSLAGEYRRGADVDLLKIPGALRTFNNIANRSALAGLTDASVHVLNQATSLLTRPSVAGGVLQDSLLSAFGRADVPVTLTKALVKGFQDNKEQLSQLAEIGALRQEHPTVNPLAKLINWTDKTTRLVLDDAYQKMAKSGLVEDTETNRREFVNQVGQYNKRAQGDLRRLARDSGFGPFATAGTTFNTLGLRTMTGSPGIPATSGMAAGALRANAMSKWLGAFVLTGALNYLLTKDKEGGGVMGRPGVPIGRIDTGQDNENGQPLSLPLFDILGLGRALRVTGARGFIESQRKGLSLQNSLDAAATDLWNTNISPFVGPAIRFAGVASSGKQVPAINVPRTSQIVPPGESQTGENIKQAVIDANPVLKSLYLSQEPGQGAAAAARQQIPRLSLQPSQSAEFMSKYPEIVRKAQAREYVNDVIGRARKMNPDDQVTYVQGALDNLGDEDRKQAERVMKYSHIRYQ